MIQVYKHRTWVNVVLPIVQTLLWCLLFIPPGYSGSSIGEKTTFSGNYGYTIIGNTESTGEAANECGEKNGTSRYLFIPSGASVYKAYLYWSGSSYYSGSSIFIDQSVTLNNQTISADGTWTESINNGGYYQDFYAAYADVTGKISGSTNVTIDQLAFDKTVSCAFGSVYGGWSLVVIYTKPDLPNRTIKLYDGFYGYWPNPIKNFYQQWNLDGFTIPSCNANIELSAIIWEGDHYKGEKTYIDGKYFGDNLLAGSNSFDNSSNYNLDIDRYNLDDVLSPGQTDFVFRVESYQVGNAWEFHLDNVFILQYDNCENTCLPEVSFTNNDCTSILVKKGSTTVTTINGGNTWTGDASDGEVYTFYIGSNVIDSYTVSGCEAQNYTVHPGGCGNLTCPEDLIVNPSFEHTVQGWNVAGSYDYTTYNAVDGNYLIYLWPTGSSQSATIAQNIDVTPGILYTLDFYAGTTDPGQNHSVSLEFYTQAGTLLGAQSVQIDHDLTSDPNLKSYNLTMTAPTGSKYVRIIGRANSDYLKLDAFCLTTKICTAPELVCEYNDGSGWQSENDCIVDICEGTSLTLSANPNGLRSYQWSGPNGFSGSGNSDGNILISNAITTVQQGIYTVTVTDNQGCLATTSITVNVSKLDLVLMPVSAGCSGANDGSVDLTIHGGISPYTYVWSTGATTEDIQGLSPGDYTVTVTDAAGCSKTKKTTVGQPVKIDVSTEYVEVSCHGGSDGSITLHVQGGSTPYSYQWSNGATTKNLTNIPSGDYAVTVTDANGCMLTSKRWVGEPDQLDASLSVTNPGCSAGDGSIQTSVSGGNTPYHYAWSNGATTKNISHLAVGTYTVTVTDNHNCTLVKSATVASSGAPLVNIACASEPLESRSVSNSERSCSPSINYGLWTDYLADKYSSSPYWSVQNGSFKEYDNGTAYLEMVVTNVSNHNISFTVKSVFKGRTFSPPAESPKENTQCVGNLNNKDWYYYTETEGYLIGGGNLTGALIRFTRNGPSFQVGTGAHLNNSSKFGASGWLTLTLISQPTTGPGLYVDANHSDFDFQLSGSSVTDEPQCLLICAGNQVTLTANANGGKNPYSYSWSTGSHASSITVSPTTTTTYTVTVTDANGCSSTDQATVTVSNALETSIEIRDITCPGDKDGSIDLTITDGTGPFAFSWSNGATTEDISGLQAGTYQVTITDGAGCQRMDEGSIDEPDALSLEVYPLTETCPGEGNGEIDLTVLGGTLPYHYQWSNGATTEDLSGLTEGTYSVTVTDGHGCSATDQATIVAPDAIELNLNPNAVTCGSQEDGAINLSVSGGKAPYLFTWSNGATTEDLTGLSAGNYRVTVTDASGCSVEDEASVTTPTPLDLQLIPTPVYCAGSELGTIDVTVSGGSTPYTFLWNNGATTEDLSGLAPGTYTVTVTDAHGCTASDEASISSPTSIQLLLTSKPVDCHASENGSIDLSISGGAIPYLFVWSDGSTTQNLSELSAGNYQVTVTDANGCTATGQTTIDEPDPIHIDPSSVDVRCQDGADGSIHLSVSGGNPPYSYLWNNGATTRDIDQLVAGNYAVTVTDANGCQANTQVTIDEPDAMNIHSEARDEWCNGSNDGSIELNVTGGTGPYQYAWSNGVTTRNLTGLTSGIYSVTVTDAHGCIVIDLQEIHSPDPLQLEIERTNANCDAADGSAEVHASGGTSPYTYTWSNGETTQKIGSLGSGTYSVTVTDANGCAQEESVFITGQSNLSAAAVAQDATCNNATDGQINLTVTGGAAPLNFLWSNGATTEDLEDVPAGNYSVTVTDGYGCSTDASAVVKGKTVIRVSAIPTPTDCNGGSDGSIELIIQGGISPITYQWSNGASTKKITGLSAGNYSVTITDGYGCTGEASTVIEEPEPLTLSLKAYDITCNETDGGQIVLTVIGGTAPYLYHWSNGAGTKDLTNLAPDNYEVTVTDANGCAATGHATITLLGGLDIEITKNDATCNGSSDGSIEVNINGGQSPYAYVWSNGATTQKIEGLGYGTYGVTVTDANGCSASGEEKINIPDAINLEIVGSNTTCDGSDGQASVSAHGGTLPYKFLWSNDATSKNITSLEAGTYYVTVTDQKGCHATGEVNIEQGSGKLDVVVQGGAIDCAHASVILTATTSTAIATFQWTGPGGFNSDDEEPEVSTPGVYTVTITDVNGCRGFGSGEVTSKVDVPELSVTGGKFDCGQSAVQLTVISSIEEVEYRWFGPDGFISSEQNPVVTTPGKYTVMATTLQGCIGQTSIDVTANNSGPLFELSAPSFNCVASQVQIQLTVLEETSYEILWIGPNGFISNEEDPIIDLPGTYHITVTSVNGCTSQKDITVGTSGGFNLELIADTISCLEPAVNIQVVGLEEITSFKWSGPNGYSSDRSTPLVDIPGIYTLIAYSINGCLDTASVEVIENLFDPDVRAKGGIITCEEGSVRLSGYSETPDAIYFWSGPDNFESTESSPEVTLPGDYQLTVKTVNGCESTTIVSVTRETCSEIGDKIWLDGNCDGWQDSTEFGVDSILVQLYTCDSVLVAETYSDSNGMYYFKNLAPDKMYFVAIDRLPPGFTFSPHIDSIPDSLDTNIILYSNRTECFAIAPNTIDTTIDIGLCRIDTCLLYVEAETYVISCGQDSVQLLPKVNESILNYLWEGPGGFVSAIANPWVSVPGKYYVTVSDDYGCEATACIIVTISNTVDITVTGGSVPCDGNGTYLFVSSENPNASFWWVGPDGFTSREQNPLVQSPGMYWVTVQDTINGCFDKKLVEVLLDCCNVTDGGILSGDETGCGPYDPLPIISVNDPSGGAGDLQYMWIKTNDPSLPFSQWTMIWDGHGSEYDPGLITETTYYSRCSKRAACDEWIGETNVIVKRVIDLPEVVADSVSITSEATCGGDNGEMTIRMTSGTFGPFMVRLVVDGKELVFGPFADRVIVIRGLSPGHYTRVQISNAFACYSVDVDLDLIIHLSNCFDEYSGDQIHIHPNPASTELNLSVKLSPRNQDVQIELVNLVGTVVKRIEKSNNQIKNNEFRERMDVHDIHAGMYYIRIRNGSEVRFIPVEILK